MRLSADDLLCLARAYSGCVGISLITTGVRAAGNDKIFVRLATGRTCTVRSLERAARWFGCNWPVGLDWPEDIPRPEPCIGPTPGLDPGAARTRDRDRAA